MLDVAHRLRKLLTARPGFDVVLTRQTDEFIPLEERTAIANREGADLFLSIHANASRQSAARGVETYILNFATNPAAEAVAARENATSAQTMGTLPAILKAIALNNKLAESRELATILQTSLVRKLRAQNKGLRDLGVKQAPFVVLIGAQMPSVLAEISFLTNKSEASLLKQSGLPPADRPGALRRDPQIPGLAEEGHDDRDEPSGGQDGRTEPSVGAVYCDQQCRKHPDAFIVTVIKEPAKETTLADVIVGSLGITGLLVLLALVPWRSIVAVVLVRVEPAPPGGGRLPPVTPTVSEPPVTDSSQAR